MIASGMAGLDSGAAAAAVAATSDPAADAAAAVAAALRGLPQHVPVQYDRLGRELQKWIQCNKCEKWRKVPYGLDDGDIPEEWQVSSDPRAWLPACLFGCLVGVGMHAQLRAFSDFQGRHLPACGDNAGCRRTILPDFAR